MNSDNVQNKVTEDTKFAIRMLFEEVKEELDEHLYSINENTNEIASNYIILN